LRSAIGWRGSPGSRPGPWRLWFGLPARSVAWSPTGGRLGTSSRPSTCPRRADQHPNPPDHPPRVRLPLPRRRHSTRDALTRRPLPTPTRTVTPPTVASVGSHFWAPRATLRAIPDFGCGGTFLLDSASVEMIPAVIMEDVRACVELALSRRSDRERNNFPRAPVGSISVTSRSARGRGPIAPCFDPDLMRRASVYALHGLGNRSQESSREGGAGRERDVQAGS